MKFTKVTAVMTVGAMMLTGCAGGKTVIKAGDTKITEADIAFIADFYYEQNMQYGQSADYDSIKGQIVDAFKDAVLISEVADLKEVELSDESKQMYLSEIASFRMSFGGKNAFDKELKKSGADEDTIEDYYKANYLSTVLKSIPDFQVSEPTEEELKTYFKDNYWRAKHVLISIDDAAVTDDLEKTEAEKILERAKSGEDFDKLVEEFSEDPGSAVNPDGYVFTKNEMVPEFEDGTKSIKPGEFTLVKSNYGYHIIQRLALDESDEKFAEFFENNKKSAKSKYSSDKFDELLKKYAEDNGITVEVNEEAIAKMTAPEVDTTDEETAQ